MGRRTSHQDRFEAGRFPGLMPPLRDHPCRAQNFDHRDQRKTSIFFDHFEWIPQSRICLGEESRRRRMNRERILRARMEDQKGA